MENIGLFEAKTKLSEICAKVNKDRQPILITKRGKPFVRIDPVEKNKSGVWDLAKEFKRKHGPIKDDLKLPSRLIDDDIKNPLD